MKKATIRKVIANYSAFETIMAYKKPKTKYTSEHNALPNPSCCELWTVYCVLKMAADGDTGVARISQDSICDITQISKRDKVAACINILESLKVLYCLKGGLYYSVKKYANQYIFPMEHWDYPDPENYNDYILNPGKYLIKEEKGEKKPAARKTKKSSPESEKTTPAAKKEKSLPTLFESPSKDIYKLKNKAALDDLIKNTTLQNQWSKLSLLDKEAIKDVQKWLFSDDGYQNRYQEGAHEYGLNREEIDWILKPVEDKYREEHGGKL